MTDHRRPPEPHLSREALRILSLTADEKKADRGKETRHDRSLPRPSKPKACERLWM